MTLTAELAVDVRCELGEGPIWHPERNTLIFFDILRRTLFEARADGTAMRTFGFGDVVSAAGWIDATSVAVVGAEGVMRLDLDAGSISPMAVAPFDAARVRSNDARVAPDGAFWIGSMGRAADPGVGALHRFAGGAFETLRADVTIPNATCFSPDGARAYFADTARKIVWRTELDGVRPTDWDVFLDLNADGLNPDGATVDAEGRLWLALWGSGRVDCFAPDGRRETSVAVPAPNSSCPCFGGPDFKTLYVTTAREHMTAAQIAEAPLSGAVFAIELDVAGQAEHRFAP